MQPRLEVVEGVFHGRESIGLGSRLKDWIASFGHERRELNRGRRTADVELRSVDSVPMRLAWRSAELTAGGERLELAHEIRALVRAASPRYLPGAVPLRPGCGSRRGAFTAGARGPAIRPRPTCRAPGNPVAQGSPGRRGRPSVPQSSVRLDQPSRRSLQRWRIKHDRTAERRIRGGRSLGRSLMFDLAAIAIAARLLRLHLRRCSTPWSGSDVGRRRVRARGLARSCSRTSSTRSSAGSGSSERPGHRPDRRLRGRPDRARVSARPLHGAGLRAARFRVALAVRGSSAASTGSSRTDARARAGLEELREDGARLQRSSSSACSTRSSACRRTCS